MTHAILSSTRSYLRNGLVALMLCTTALPAFAEAPAAPTIVTSQELERVEQEWQTDEVKAVVSLGELGAILRTTGKVDHERNVSNTYWMLARILPVVTKDCDAAYEALYHATVLGFLEQWPQRAKAHAALTAQLNACVPLERRKAIAGAALTSLNTTALQPWVKFERAEQASLLAEPKTEGSLMTEMFDSASVSLGSIMSTVITLATGLAVLSIIFTMYRGAMGGSSGSSSSTDSRSSSSTMPPRPAAPPSSKDRAGIRDKRPANPSRTAVKRGFMQRLNPWR